jgi:hypothetical protein
MEVLSIAKDFSRMPAGRVKADGRHSGERFREMYLPLLRRGPLTIDFDGTLGYGSSFLQEAFVGLVQEPGVDTQNLTLVCTEDESIVTEVWRYVNSTLGRR